jgi:hypothetical protein
MIPKSGIRFSDEIMLNQKGKVRFWFNTVESESNLKFLHYLQRVRLREFQIESGTRIIKLLVPFVFRRSLRGVL